MLGFMNRINLLALGAVLLPLLGGCQGSGGSIGVEWGDAPSPPEARQGRLPPDHAPAHGRRAQQREYQYYPHSNVYFDSGRGIYFYLADGQWQISVELPRRYRVRLGEYVMVEADREKPYRDYKKHRAKYPPGLRKKGRGHQASDSRGHEKWDE